jgi:hypothetical protein
MKQKSIKSFQKNREKTGRPKEDDVWGNKDIAEKNLTSAIDAH